MKRFLTSFLHFAPDNGSGMHRLWTDNGPMKSRKLFALLFTLIFVGVGNAWGTVLFHETFGNNTGSARDWNNSYSVKSGVSAVYSGITGYTVSNCKQGKNTTGSTQSGLNQSTQGTDAYIIIGPLSVASYTSLNVTYQWKAASIKGTYTTKLYYATSSGGSYTEVAGTGTGATSFVERSYSLPVAAQVSTLYLKIVWNTSNTQAIIDEVELTGTAAASCDKKVTIVKGTPETGGSFNLDKTGAQDCCSALTVTVSNITAPSGKEFDAITQSGIATGVTINQSAKTVTYAANSTGTSTINVTFRDLPKYTVTLMDDDDTRTQASYGASVTLPSRTGCTDYTFAGWTKTWVAPQSSWTTTAPTIIPAGSYTPSANENLYPVYTKTEGGGSSTASSESISSTSTSAVTLETGKPITYTCSESNTYSNPARIYKNKSITIAGGTITSISLTGVSDYAISNMTANTGTLTTDGDNGTWTGSASSITFTASTAQTRISALSVSYTGGSTTYYISVPDCCTPLGSLNGSINMSSSTDGTVTISGWTYNAGSTGTTESNVSSYTVKLYKWNGSAWAIANASSTTGGSSGTAATRTGIATDSKSVTYSGLEYGGTYKFTVQAIGNGSSYCNGEETAVTSINGNSLTDNKFLNKYYFHIDDGTQSDTGWENHYLASINASHVGTVNVTLTQDVDYYQYKLTLGGVIWWGNTGKMTSANHSGWTFTTGASNCKLQTSLGGTYTFSATVTTPSVTVTYPTANQASGKKIWFDKSVITGWTDADASQLYWRIGKPSHTTVNSDETANYFSLVPGTDRFYVYETKGYDGFEAWHIANNTAWSGSSDNNPDYDNHGIYTHYHNQSSTDVTRATVYQKYVVGNDGVTLVPTTKKNTDWYCDFWNVDKTDGMLTHNVAVSTAAHGTLVATYTNTSGTTGQTVTEGNDADLAHRCILTITATPDDGYTCTSLTLNGDAFTSGNTHILTADATIAATFTANKYDVTLKTTSQTGSVTDQVVQATYDAAMPTTVKTAGTAIVIPERTGYSFTGWFDNSSGGKQYYQYTGSPKTLSSANAWDKTSATYLYAQWSINSYTLTWVTVRGKVTTAGTGAAVDATGNIISSQEYNTALTAPVLGGANGYTFTGWSPTPAENMPAENTTYTAQWSANQYTVTLNNHGATTAGTESVTATFDAAMPAITPPEKTGYRFDGYYTAASGGTKYYNADGTSATIMKLYGASPTLHAHWVAQLTFSVNGVLDDELTRDDNTAMPSTATVPTACGDCWAFMGWSTNSSESGAPAYAGGATHEFGEPTTLYAVFGKTEYKLISDLSDLEANEYYVLSALNSNEYAMSNTTTDTYYATSVDITSDLKENADGWYLYNPPVSVIWKFTGTTSSGRLYNEAASKYLDLSSNSATILQSSTSDYLKFTKFDSELFNIASTTQTSYFLYMYSGNKWSVDNEHDGYSSCYIYKRQSATYATEPNCETYDIVWKVDGTPLASGSQTEETNTCAGIEELPTDPDDDELDCATKFMGWSESTLIGTGQSAPADLFTTVGNAPTIDEDKTFHAVFASVDTESEAPADITTTFTSTAWGDANSLWTSDKAATATGDSRGVQVNKNETGAGAHTKDSYNKVTSVVIIYGSASDASGSIAVSVGGTAMTLSSGSISGGQSDQTLTYTPTAPATSLTGVVSFVATVTNKSIYIKSIQINYKTFGYKDYMTSCCSNLITISNPSIDGTGCTITFDKSSPAETCSGDLDIEATVTVTPGYSVTALSFSGGDVSIDPGISTPLTSSQVYTLSFDQGTTATLTTNATVVALRDEYYDYMHDNVKKYNKDGNYNTVPTLSSKTAATEAGCKDNHYKFKGWVVEDEINEDGTLKDGYMLITGGTTGKYATGKKYYAVWAEEE